MNDTCAVICLASAQYKSTVWQN